MATRGTKASGGTDFVTGYTIDASEMNTDLNNAFTGINNIVIADANVSGSANIDPGKIGDYSADATEMRINSNPFTASTWVAATESLATTIEEELARLRFMVKAITGGTYWYSRANHGMSIHTTGDLKWTLKTSADTGWILWAEGTIGETGSGATIRANDDCVDLYALIYTNFDDTLCPVTGGRGASAAADFAAGKVMQLPRAIGRQFGLAGTPSSGNDTTYITGTATAGSAAPAGTTITLSANGSAPPADDLINSYTIATTGGAGSGQVRTISDYVASTRVVTISSAWTTTTDNTTQYAIYKTIPTRSLGATLGSDETVQVLSHTHTTDQVDDAAGGAAKNLSAGAAPANAGLSILATGTTTAISRYAPTWFGNVMIKL